MTDVIDETASPKGHAEAQTTAKGTTTYPIGNEGRSSAGQVLDDLLGEETTTAPQAERALSTAAPEWPASQQLRVSSASGFTSAAGGQSVATLQPIHKVLFEVVKDGKHIENQAYPPVPEGPVYLLLIDRKIVV